MGLQIGKNHAWYQSRTFALTWNVVLVLVWASLARGPCSENSRFGDRAFAVSTACFVKSSWNLQGISQQEPPHCGQWLVLGAAAECWAPRGSEGLRAAQGCPSDTTAEGTSSPAPLCWGSLAPLCPSMSSEDGTWGTGTIGLCLLGVCFAVLDLRCKQQDKI